MEKIHVFICASSKDVDRAEIIRETLTECYGFDAFLFRHSLIGSQDFHKEILIHLDRCEIFIPCLSKNLLKSSFCNQEIGFAVHRLIKKQLIIYPISFDGTETFNLIDHTQTVVCNGNDKYGELKVTTGFFNIVVSHRDFMPFQQRAIENMLDILVKTKNWKAISTIPYTFDAIREKVTLSKKQTDKIVCAIKTNQALISKPAQKIKLSSFLRERFQITID